MFSSYKSNYNRKTEQINKWQPSSRQTVSAVLMRLVFPISFTSTFSSLSVINPGMQQTSGALAYVPYNMGLMQTPSIDVGVDGINKAVNSSLPQAVLGAGVNPMQIVIAILSIVWVVGVAVLSLYSVIWRVSEIINFTLQLLNLEYLSNAVISRII